MLTIRSIGFSDAERRLLIKQLEILNARLNYEWQYKGEGTHGQLILAKQPVEVPNLFTTLVLVDIKSHADHYCIDRPIRLMQLSEVLERTGEKCYSIALDLRNLLNKNNAAPFSLKCAHNEIYFEPQEKTIHYTGNPLTGLINCLSKIKPRKLTETHFTNATIPENITNTYPYKSILWLIAKKEDVYAQTHWHDTGHFKISSWPNLSWVYNNTTTKSIALLLSRSFLSISEVAKATNSDSNEVKLFLHCCDTVGIKILTSQDNANTPPRKAKGNAKLIFWLKKKINSILKNAD